MKRVLAALLVAALTLAPLPLAAQEIVWTQADTDRITADLTYVWIADGPGAACRQIDGTAAMLWGAISYWSGTGILTGTPSPMLGFLYGWSAAIGGLYWYFDCANVPR